MIKKSPVSQSVPFDVTSLTGNSTDLINLNNVQEVVSTLANRHFGKHYGQSIVPTQVIVTSTTYFTSNTISYTGLPAGNYLVMVSFDAYKSLAKNKGQNETGYLFRVSEDTNFIIDNCLFAGDPDAFDVLLAFNDALKERNIDLIVIPVPNQTQTYSYMLFDDMSLEHEIWPVYIKGMIKLLENDIEVLDITYEYRQYMQNNKSGMKLLCENNHHWNSPGMEIAANALMKRLSR